MASYADPSSVERVEQVEWVESGGGPLIAIPEVVLPFWTGADGDELASDYDRACEVEGLIGLVPVGNTTALVLGDEPAATTYLPEHGTFVRWSAGDSERELLAGVPDALATAEWGREVHWQVPGTVVLFDAAWPGRRAERPGHLRITLEPGRYAVRAAHAEPGPETWIGLVQLRPLES
ncbi:immunity 21 family protein [Streptomyces sp. NPDC059517]|uniref:immunity 21 family protein n=1 Tax=Streptomyces sp. NPDC059517 TaxID=3346855 RepID=UPI0036A1B738